MAATTTNPLPRRAGGLPALLAAVTLTQGLGCSPVKWTWDLPGQMPLTPLVLTDLVVVHTSRFGVSQEMIALDVATGAPRWIQREVGWGPCQHLVGDASGIFIVCGEELTALSPSSGAIRWRLQLPGEVKEAPLLTPEALLVRLTPDTPGEAITRRDGPRHGEQVGTSSSSRVLPRLVSEDASVWNPWVAERPAYAWLFMLQEDLQGSRGEAPLPAAPRHTPQVSADGELAFPVDPTPAPAQSVVDQPPAAPLPIPRTVLEPGGPNVLLLLDPQKGDTLQEVWGGATHPWLFEERILVWGGGGQMVALDITEHSVRWSRPTGVTPGEEGQIGLTSAAGGTLVLTHGGEIEALDLRSGARLWSHPTQGRVQPRSAADVVFWLEEGAVVCVEPRSGVVRWSASAAGVTQAPTSDGSHLFLQPGRGAIEARRLSDGGVVWQQTGVDGHLVVGPTGVAWTTWQRVSVVDVVEGSTQTLSLPLGWVSARRGGAAAPHAELWARQGLFVERDGRIIALEF